MKDENGSPASGHDVDPGEPIEGLVGFEHDASVDFLSRVRRAIHRRTTVAQVASFTWNVPFLVFIEFWTTLVDHLLPKSPRKDQHR